MQTLTINFYQRIMLTQLIGNHPTTNLREASTYLRIIEKIRLTDKEMRDSQFVADGGKFTWKLLEDGYGTRVVELERDEVNALVAAIEDSGTVRVMDAEWMIKMVEELKHVNTTV